MQHSKDVCTELEWACIFPPMFSTILVSTYERAVSNSVARPGNIIRLLHSIRLTVSSFDHVFLLCLQSLERLLGLLSILARESLEIIATIYNKTGINKF
jgi:hypothetical protein